MSHVLVMAKEPVAGRVKTRLCPPYTPEEAAAVAAAALADTLAAVAACRAERRILALAGEPGPWLPTGLEVIAQRGVGLAQRLANAWVDAGGPGIQIGMDTPQVRPCELDRLLGHVEAGRVVLGHARDGGWWIIGLAGVDPRAVFDNVPMSTPITGQLQERRLLALGLAVRRAPLRRDIDTAADLAAVAAEAPWTRTAALFCDLSGGGRQDLSVA
jgi:glycosyltransferase A (GT-A) superfamily protein (DUF2064 family)